MTKRKTRYKKVPLEVWNELIEVTAAYCGALHAWGGNLPEGPLHFLRPRDADRGATSRTGIGNRNPGDLIDPEHKPLQQLMDIVIKIREYEPPTP